MHWYEVFLRDIWLAPLMLAVTAASVTAIYRAYSRFSATRSSGYYAVGALPAGLTGIQAKEMERLRTILETLTKQARGELSDQVIQVTIREMIEKLEKTGTHDK